MRTMGNGACGDSGNWEKRQEDNGRIWEWSVRAMGYVKNEA